MNSTMHDSQHRCRPRDTTTEQSSEHHNENHYRQAKLRRMHPRSSSQKTNDSPQTIAQMYNNHGVQCIESGKYDEAIMSLAKAFKFCQSATEEKGCDCPHCDLHSVIAYSTASSTSAKGRETQPQDGGDEETDEGFLYSSGIWIPQECQGHFIGRVFQVVVSYNLALANHLKWRINKDTNDHKMMKRIMRLYELAYYLEIDDSSMVDIKFTVIIVNNLSQIHLHLKNYNKYKISLHHLLKHLMMIANYQRYPSLVGSSSQNEMNLDGFFANASRIILKKSTAAAA